MAGYVHIDTSEVTALAAHMEAYAAGFTPLAETAVARAGLSIEASAKGIAPVETGALKNSIAAHTGGLSTEVTTGVEYAIYQEFGTRYMHAQPFMGPAFDGELPRFEDTLGRLAEQVV